MCPSGQRQAVNTQRTTIIWRKCSSCWVICRDVSDSTHACGAAAHKTLPSQIQKSLLAESTARSCSTDEVSVVSLLGPFVCEFRLTPGLRCVGQLRNIAKLRYWGLKDVLTDKYLLDPEEAAKLASFLLPMVSVP